MNAKCNLVTVLLLCCLIFPGNAQEFNWQDLVNRKQYAAVIAHADSLTLADSSNYEIMNAIGQAYEGMLRYQKAYDYYRLCYGYDELGYLKHLGSDGDELRPCGGCRAIFSSGIIRR